jgi:hypothetical protein
MDWELPGQRAQPWATGLPQSFIDAQWELSRQILPRMRAFGMTPVLPAFQVPDSSHSLSRHTRAYFPPLERLALQNIQQRLWTGTQAPSPVTNFSHKFPSNFSHKFPEPTSSAVPRCPSPSRCSSC